ncbi:hypothetical protein VNO77_43840 [Canavalia gladiata]|uniref:Uncharacterized protein n=1 Tax=Canavalia gladiata TaxID=3824 RepID=A0AAN9PQ79_CANGL
MSKGWSSSVHAIGLTLLDEHSTYIVAIISSWALGKHQLNCILYESQHEVCVALAQAGCKGCGCPVAKLTWSTHRYETLPSTYCARYRGLGLLETLGIMHANRMGSNCNNTNREKESMHGTVLGSSFEESQKLGLYDNVGVTRPLRGIHWPHHSVRILSWRGRGLLGEHNKILMSNSNGPKGKGNSQLSCDHKRAHGQGRGSSNNFLVKM